MHFEFDGLPTLDYYYKSRWYPGKPIMYRLTGRGFPAPSLSRIPSAMKRALITKTWMITITCK